MVCDTKWHCFPTECYETTKMPKKKSSKWQSNRGETLKSFEMEQSWYTDLLKYENLTRFSHRNRKILYFTTSYKTNLVKFVKNTNCLTQRTGEELRNGKRLAHWLSKIIKLTKLSYRNTKRYVMIVVKTAILQEIMVWSSLSPIFTEVVLCPCYEESDYLGDLV